MAARTERERERERGGENRKRGRAEGEVFQLIAFRKQSGPAECARSASACILVVQPCATRIPLIAKVSLLYFRIIIIFPELNH